MLKKTARKHKHGSKGRKPKNMSMGLAPNPFSAGDTRVGDEHMMTTPVPVEDDSEHIDLNYSSEIGIELDSKLSIDQNQTTSQVVRGIADLPDVCEEKPEGKNIIEEDDPFYSAATTNAHCPKCPFVFQENSDPSALKEDDLSEAISLKGNSRRTTYNSSQQDSAIASCSSDATNLTDTENVQPSDRARCGSSSTLSSDKGLANNAVKMPMGTSVKNKHRYDSIRQNSAKSTTGPSDVTDLMETTNVVRSSARAHHGSSNFVAADKVLAKKFVQMELPIENKFYNRAKAICFVIFRQTTRIGKVIASWSTRASDDCNYLEWSLPEFIPYLINFRDVEPEATDLTFSAIGTNDEESIIANCIATIHKTSTKSFARVILDIMLLIWSSCASTVRYTRWSFHSGDGRSCTDPAPPDAPFALVDGTARVDKSLSLQEAYQAFRTRKFLARFAVTLAESPKKSVDEATELLAAMDIRDPKAVVKSILDHRTELLAAMDIRDPKAVVKSILDHRTELKSRDRPSGARPHKSKKKDVRRISQMLTKAMEKESTLEGFFEDFENGAKNQISLEFFTSSFELGSEFPRSSREYWEPMLPGRDVDAVLASALHDYMKTYLFEHVDGKLFLSIWTDAISLGYQQMEQYYVVYLLRVQLLALFGSNEFDAFVSRAITRAVRTIIVIYDDILHASHKAIFQAIFDQEFDTFAAVLSDAVGPIDENVISRAKDDEWRHMAEILPTPLIDEHDIIQNLNNGVMSSALMPGLFEILQDEIAKLFISNG